MEMLFGGIVGYGLVTLATLWVVFRTLCWYHGVQVLPPDSHKKAELWDFCLVIGLCYYVAHFVDRVHPSFVYGFSLVAMMIGVIEAALWGARGTGRSFQGYGE